MYGEGSSGTGGRLGLGGAGGGMGEGGRSNVKVGIAFVTASLGTFGPRAGTRPLAPFGLHDHQLVKR